MNASGVVMLMKVGGTCWGCMRWTMDGVSGGVEFQNSGVEVPLMLCMMMLRYVSCGQLQFSLMGS